MFCRICKFLGDFATDIIRDQLLTFVLFHMTMVWSLHFPCMAAG